MRRYGQAAAGLVFGLTLAALIVFWTVKDTNPSGSAVFPILYGVLGASALIWLIAEIQKRRVERHERREPEQERRELLSVAQRIQTELDTCRSRLSEAKAERDSWRQLPADVYNPQWATSPLTADEVAVNEALRHFYVWADEMNGKMARRAAAEYSAVGTVVDGPVADLDGTATAEFDEGLSRVENAQVSLGALIERLTASRR